MINQFKITKEENISRFIFIFPLIGIVLTVIILTILIARSDYKNLDYEIRQIRKNYIENQKKELKSSINEVKKFIKFYTPNKEKNAMQKSTLNFIKDVISKENGYVFVIDDNANIVYHPNIKEGTNTGTFRDKNGIKIADTIIRKAKHNSEGVYFSYYWPKIKGSKSQLKTIYVYYFEDWNWIISIGTYLDDINKKINEKIKYQEELTRKRVSNTINVSILISIIILLISYFFSKIIKNIFFKYRKSLNSKKRKLIRLNKDLKKIAKEEKLKRSKKEKELETMYTDRLTNLPNRLSLSNVLENITYSKLLILNINRFTDINNFYSSLIADELLKSIANLLVETFKNEKCINVFKLPTDEYAILSTKKDGKEGEFIDTCKIIIKLIESNPFFIDNNEIIVSIAGGISLTHENTFVHADTALKKAKEKNIDFFVHNEEDHIEINFQNNIKWTKLLKSAIDEDRIVIFKQVIIHNTSKVKKYECLIRIKEKDGSIISPFAFLDIAKRIKVYPFLTKIVIAKAFEHFKNLKCEFSINLTLDDITNESIVNYIKYELENNDIGKRVIFEIVESEGIDNFEEVSLFINKMREYGCKIAIDDFGTGYSNFEYLMKLNVDYIKIDGSFIKNIDVDAQSQLITKLIITFAKEQNIKTVAEFVHSEEVFEKIKSLGIDYAQGYYLGEPKECI